MAPIAVELFESRVLLSASALAAPLGQPHSQAAENSDQTRGSAWDGSGGGMNAKNGTAAAHENQLDAWWSSAAARDVFRNANDPDAGDRSDDGSTSGDARQLAFTVEPSDGTAGQPFSVTVTVEDSSGNVVTGDQSTVTLKVADGPGTFASGRTLTATAVDGVAVFDNVVLNRAGTYTLGARSESTDRATSASFTIAPDTTNTEHLAFLDSVGGARSHGHHCGGSDSNDESSSSNSQATTSSSASDDESSNSSDEGAKCGSGKSTSSGTAATAGQTLPPFKVAVQDQFGNVVTTDNTSTVTLAVKSGPTNAVVDTASVMTATVQNGVATFDHVILDTAGAYMFTATDSNSAVNAAVSGTFTVNPSSATQLVVRSVTAPGTSGEAIRPGITVVAEDQFGNVVSDDNATVTLHTSSHSPSSFSAGSKVTAKAVKGVATFDNIVFDTVTPLPAGTMPYFVFATQGSLTSANSNAIEIT